MPTRRVVDPALHWLVREQDWVLHRDQALGYGHSSRSIEHRLITAQWQIILPDVYICHPGEATRRQM